MTYRFATFSCLCVFVYFAERDFFFRSAQGVQPACVGDRGEHV